ncbi:DUF3575 domain-containing protein [Parabacteroides pacaensis]|uniref:DUF3575 domain-containing protein n=1 Tax=Parabacteroides pacaensis TaxID=2086575 RepID=UPI000D10E37B|nr:DUF3575 domain-containing protein [Parabacteroides pacaensis]
MDFISCALLFLFLPQGYARQGEGAARSGKIEVDRGMKEETKRPLFALKTNLLFDVALMPNVEVEVPIARHWSVNGEYMFPWWQFDKDKYCLQILSGGLEGLYWLDSRKKHPQRGVLEGHFPASQLISFPAIAIHWK